MQLTLCGGDDDLAVRAHHAAVLTTHTDLGAPERIDLPDDPVGRLIDAVLSPSMFTPARLIKVTGVEHLTADEVDQLTAAAAAGSDAIIVGRYTGAIAPGVRKKLTALGDVHSHAIPRGKALAGRVREIGQSHGVTFTSEPLTVVTERAGHDLNRVDTIARQLAAVGLSRPSTAQVTQLLGTSAAPGVPWELSDALERGQLAAALTAAAHCDPFATLGYLTSRLLQAGRVVEADARTSEDVMALLGLAHKFQADKLRTLASRLGPAGVAASLDVLLAADTAAKTRDARTALDIALGHLTPLWSGR